MLLSSLLPILAQAVRDDGDDDQTQCENCSSTSILILGGVAENGNDYYNEGYEYFRDFILNEYELGDYTPDLVKINTVELQSYSETPNIHPPKKH